MTVTRDALWDDVLAERRFVMADLSSADSSKLETTAAVGDMTFPTRNAHCNPHSVEEPWFPGRHFQPAVGVRHDRDGRGSTTAVIGVVITVDEEQPRLRRPGEPRYDEE